MTIAIVPHYEFTTTLSQTAAYEFTCDSTLITSDDIMTVDSSFKSLYKYSATIPSFSFNYVLTGSVCLTSDSSLITCDNLITVDNG